MLALRLKGVQGIHLKSKRLLPWCLVTALVVASACSAVVSAVEARTATPTITSASTAELTAPKSPIAFVSNPKGHAVCVPYANGMVCASVVAFTLRPQPNPSSAIPLSPVSIVLANRSDRSVTVPIYSGLSSLTLGILFQFNQSSWSASFEAGSAHHGCAPASGVSVIIDPRSSVLACGGFRMPTSTWFNSTPLKGQFESLTVGGIAMFASRFAQGVSELNAPGGAPLAMSGPFLTNGKNPGDAGTGQNINQVYFGDHQFLGVASITTWTGRPLGYDAAGISRLPLTPTQKRLCATQAAESDSSSICAADAPSVPSSGAIVIRYTLGLYADVPLVVSAPGSFIDVQYGCDRGTGCNSARLFPESLPSSVRPAGCDSTSGLRLTPKSNFVGSALQYASPPTLGEIPTQTRTRMRTLCVVYRVPPDSTIYNGLFNLDYEPLGSPVKSWADYYGSGPVYFTQLPRGSF